MDVGLRKEGECKQLLIINYYLLMSTTTSKTNKCKICRRAGIKLFLKGERCNSQKCAMIKRPYPPGMKGTRKTRGISEYGKELKEKQKLKNWYNLSETQFANYVKESLAMSRRPSARSTNQDAASILIRKLENRLDNMVFRFGFASSRPLARQMISHGHFFVNGKPVNIPSLQTKQGDKIRIRPNSSKTKYFKDIIPELKKKQIVSWLKFNADKLEGEVVSSPVLEEIAPPVEISAAFEYYSR